ncbi:TPA: hypothetical protein MNC05_004771 [Klebsiella pneumoniae]|uniref:hypothetical protein n=1 Tax=Klebsiella TaxID=570 RepID=UPI0012B6B07F|nr:MULTISPECIES: hypothetical protein [Klebsiella]EKT9724329.1 hypothetical protein [Klebsiella pneumoniae]EKW3446700.1 hypothetical protein [Klebsiella pneumoniae]EKW6095106.1 hypothetical protein [Klebsiella pneumoniae]QPV95722.1 hypothetical protein I8N76_17440 [Klebsiella pneumoniae]QPV98134.1 hypothetical protein I8N76_03675 [Klebsiella pneumoniae]
MSREYISTVMGNVITDALAVHLDRLELQINEELKSSNYMIASELAKNAANIEYLRTHIVVNQRVELFQLGDDDDEESPA